MNSLSHRLAITTALVSLIAVPVTAENLGDFSLRRTHPNHLSISSDRDGGPIDLHALASTGDTAETLAVETDAPSAAAELGSVAPPKAAKRKDRVDFKPRFSIRAPSRRPRYERPDYGNARVMPRAFAPSDPSRNALAGDGAVPAETAEETRALADNAAPATGAAAEPAEPKREAPKARAPKRTAPAARRSTAAPVPRPSPAPARARPEAAATAATLLAAADGAATLAATLTAEEPSDQPDRNDVPRVHPRRGAPIAMPAFDIENDPAPASSGPEVVVHDAPQAAPGNDVTTAAPAEGGAEGAAEEVAEPRIIVAALASPDPAGEPQVSDAAQGSADDQSPATATPAPDQDAPDRDEKAGSPEAAQPADTAEAGAADTPERDAQSMAADQPAAPQAEAEPPQEPADAQPPMQTASLDGGDAASAPSSGDPAAADGPSASPHPEGAGSDDHGAAADDATADEPSGPDGDTQSAERADPVATASADAGSDGDGGRSPDEADAAEPADIELASADTADEADDHAKSDGDGEAEGEEEGEPARVDNTPIPPGPTPFQLVRMLTALQDDIARGSSTALRAQRVLNRRIGERFVASAPREWAEPANGRALVTYALSGGDPTVVREVVRDAWLEDPYKRLGAGALAFIEGRADDARRHFEAVDLDGVAHSVVGSVRLAQAALAVKDDQDQAMTYLDDARLVAPGTLVEEAALRRAILLASNADDLPAFENLVGRYLRKFRGSVYAGNFRRRLAAAVTRMSFIDDPGSIERLDPLFGPMTVAGRQELYLMIARASIENGSHHATKTAAERVLATAAPDTLDYTRAELYHAAAELVDDGRLEAATATLERLRAANLPADDRSILAAALQLSQSVVTLPEAQMGEPMIAAHNGEAEGEMMAEAAEAEAEAEASAPESAEDDPLGPPVEVERRVAEALSAVDALLENTQ